MIDALPDRRALAFPDEPYSAYCKVCWQNVYCLWIDKDDHHRGECMFGATKMEDCQQAMLWAQFVGKIRSYVKSSKPPAPTSDDRSVGRTDSEGP